MEFSVATVNDFDALDALQKSCLEKLEHQDFGYILRSRNYLVLQGKIDDKVVCFVSATVSFDQSDILQVCVDENWRRQGFGKELLKELENIMKEKGVKELFLEVNENNAPALALYSSMNFSVLSKREKYYGEEDAIVMYKAL